MKKAKAKNFRNAEAVLVVVLIAIIGVTGWYVYSAKSNADQTLDAANQTSTEVSESLASNKPTASATNIGTFSDGPGTDFKTYTNKTYGFSITVPKNILTESGTCTTVDYAYNTYGYKIPAPTTSALAPAVVPTTVVEDADTFYVTQAYSSQLTDPSTSSGNTFYGGCHKVDTTVDVVRASNAPTAGVLLDTLPILVASANNDSEILSKIRPQFENSATLKIASKTTDPQGSWQNLKLSCDNPEDCQGGRSDVRYYTKQHKVVVFLLGQSAHLTNGPTIYDLQIEDSFALIK
ncbi:MAG: hypothetical protein JWM81_528 [Candidatus Saccharibacteria bacterium]|nr:hypothetical protein [Candidatus Saccharibacteria bacterium]